jgi:hypothetical protein
MGLRTTCLLIAFSMTLMALSQGMMLDIRAALSEPALPIAKLDLRGSFIGNERVQFAGIKFGLEHGARFQYGIGYSFLWSRVEKVETVPVDGAVTTRLRFGYVTPYVEYAFYRKGPWELRMPVQLGIGSGSVVYDDLGGRTRKLQKSGVFLYEPSITVQYRFLTYFGLGAGWGYRLVLRSAPLAEGLTAPIYAFGLKVFFGDLWKDIRPAQQD